MSPSEPALRLARVRSLASALFRRSRLITALAWIAFAASTAAALQPPDSQPAPSTAAAPRELPAEVLALLDQIQDFTPDYDHPGFFALARFMRQAPFSPGAIEPPTEISDWRDFMERPRSLRGAPVTLEGVVGRNKPPWRMPRHPELGQFSQMELQRAGAPLAVTLVFTEPVSDVPINSTIRVTGYFLKTRTYTSDRGRELPSAVILAAGPSDIRVVAPTPPAESSFRWQWILVALGLGLVVVWIVLKRSARPERSDVRALRAQHAPSQNLAGDLAAWAGEERRDPTAELTDSDSDDRPAR